MKEREREKERETDRQTQTDRQTDTETETERQKVRESSLALGRKSDLQRLIGWNKLMCIQSFFIILMKA